MNTFKKFALVAVMTGTAIAPLVAKAANNDMKAEPAKVAMNKMEMPDFAKIDKDHSGKISLTEYLKDSGLKETPAQIKEKFASMDKNHDGSLTKDEFSGTMVQ